MTFSFPKEVQFFPFFFKMYETGVVVARFYYQQWSDALQTVVYLWEVLLDGGLSLMPMLVQVSDIEEFNSRLRVLFRGKITGLLEGELVKKLRDKLEEVSQEIAPLALLLKKPKSLATYMELSNKKEGNARMKELIERRISEFNSAMGCLLDYLDGKVLMLKGGFNWNQIYWMIKRECRRLDDGLPIHADRKDILWQIHRQQVTSNLHLICIPRFCPFALGAIVHCLRSSGKWRWLCVLEKDCDKI